MPDNEQIPVHISAAADQPRVWNSPDDSPPGNGTYRRHDAPETDRCFWDALELTSDVAERYEIQALDQLIGSCKATLARDEISVAVLGRFKAGEKQLSQ